MALLSAGCRAEALDASEIQVRSGDVSLHVYLAGDPGSGHTLMALHGGPGMASDYMVSLEQLASPDLAVVRYDQRGTGRSSKPLGLQMAESTVSALSSAQVTFVTLAKCGHFWHECPEPVYEHVRRFLGL
jgi:pimeloyl-ACP methyl ester carboxylesterase